MNIAQLIDHLSKLPQDKEFFKIEANTTALDSKLVGRTENLKNTELVSFIRENVLYFI